MKQGVVVENSIFARARVAKILQPLRNFIAQVNFAKFWQCEISQGHFHRKGHFRMGTCLNCFSPPPLSQTYEFVKHRFPSLFICAIQFSKRKREENQAAPKPAPRLENLRIELLYFPIFSLCFLSSLPKPFTFGPFLS